MKKEEKTKLLTVDQARMRLEKQCARAEHCTYELRQKLYRWRISASDASNIIDSLIENRFVDDERFARAFINDKIRFARWGQRKIHAALLQKRIPTEMTQRLLGEIDPEFVVANLEEILEQKARTIDNVRTYEGRTRLFRYAISRGYLPDDVSRAIRGKYL